MTPHRRLASALAFDVLVVGVFVVIGRRSHDEGSALRGALETAAPFLIGLAAGWIAAQVWRRPWALISGLVVWPITVSIGMVVRKLVFDRGTAASFVIVATVFLGLGIVGWRALAHVLAQNSTATAGTS